MAAHAVIVVAAYCTLVNPAVDKIAGALPKLLPLQIVVGVADLACAIVRPTVLGVVNVLADAAQINVDIRHKGR